jgi:uncharacterized protein (TIGR02466 family)
MINNLNNLTSGTYFNSLIYLEDKPEWVNYINNVCDKYIEEAKKANEEIILEREKKLEKKINDFGMTHHSSPLLGNKDLQEFQNYISKNCWNILDHMGYDLKDYNLYFNDLWVQQFSEKGGGHHEGHVHPNSHISGFYFLKCSDKTSYPIFHDPKPGKMMIQLPEKDKAKITEASEKIYLIPIPGVIMYFPAYLKHEFTVDWGIEPFRFIHFNLQAIPKEILNYNK